MKKVLVTGSEGLLGSAIKALSNQYPYEFIFSSRKDCNLLDNKCTEELLMNYKPDYVLHNAAKVGGVLANMHEGASYFNENILMNTYITEASYKAGVEKLIVCASTCAFSDSLSEIKEELLHDGMPFKGNLYYGYAKRMADIQIQAYREQYSSNFGLVIPGNLFGENDNFNLDQGHVIPSLIHKCFLSKVNNTPLRVWGNGTQKREFIYSQDAARIIINLLEFKTLPNRLLISSKSHYSVKDVVEKISNKMGFFGEIHFESDKPSGQQSRRCNLALLDGLFPNFDFTDIDTAIERTVDWFFKNYPNIRL